MKSLDNARGARALLRDAGEQADHSAAVETFASTAAAPAPSPAASPEFRLDVKQGPLTVPLAPFQPVVTGPQAAPHDETGPQAVATSLTAGQVAIVGYNTGQSDGSGNPATLDSLSFVVLTAIGSGTQIFFTDRSWNGTTFGASGGGEGTYTYTAGADIAAGTVITLSSAQLSGAGMTLSASGDNIYVYQGTDANTPTSFLFALDFADGNNTFNASLTNTGLTAGINALAADMDSGAYSGPTTQQGSFQANGVDLLHSISDFTNWVGDSRDSVNAFVQPVQTNFLVSPDIQIWGATSGGSGDGIVGVGADSTTGLGVGINQVRFYNSDGDESAAYINLTVAPRDLVIDTVHGKFFLADSDLAGTNRILQGNLSDLLGAPGTTPTVTVLYSDTSSGTNSQIRNLQVNPDTGQVFFSHGSTTTIQRVNYDTAGQTATTLVNLGSGNPNGNSNNFVDDFVINFATGHIYITSHRVTAAADGDIVSRNYLYDASGLTSSSSSTLSYSVLPFSPDDDDAGVLTTPGEAFPRELGSLEGIAISADGSTLYFATASLLEDTDGDGGTGGGSGTAPVLRPGGIFSYALTGNAAGTFTTIFTQTIGGAGPQGLLDELEIDSVSGRWYVSDTTGGTAAAGDEGIWSGLLTGGAATLFSTIANINGGAIDGFQLNRASTLSVTGAGATYSETAGTNSGFGTVAGLLSGSTINDVDTAGLAVQTAGAVVRITTGFQTGASHQDRLTINGATSGTLTYGANSVAFSYDSATGAMVLSGAATFANYQNALSLVSFSTSGDNPTNYGAATSRTIAWSVTDGLVHSDEQTNTVTVSGTNDAPVNIVPGAAVAATEDGPAVAITGLSVSDVDANPATQNITVTLSVDQGTLTISTAVVNGLTAGGVSGNGTATLTLTGTQNQINATLANATALQFQTAPDAYGAATLTMTSNDGGLNGGGALTDTDTVTINVAAVDDLAVLQSDTVNVAETATLSGSVFADNGSGVDIDIDSTLTVTAVNGVGVSVGNQITLPSGALLTLNADGTFSYDPNGAFSAVPDDATSGASNTSTTDSFTYTVADGETATVTVTIGGDDTTGDVLQGTAGADTLDGGIGDDRIVGSAGADAINGGDGIDTVDYSGASAGVTVGLNNNNAIHDGEGSADTLTNIENVLGSAFNDLLIGDSGANTLNGWTGADILIGLDGNDILVGGTGASNQMQGGQGDDTYYVDATDTIVELVGEGLDTVATTRANYTLGANLERLFFTGAGNFTGTGNALDNSVNGSGGDDILAGRGGVDTLNGGGGLDTADYHLAAGGVTASLTTNAASNDGDGASDTFSSIENLTGSAFNDNLTGGAGVNVLIGGAGDDVLNGRAGNDQLFGGTGSDTVSYADASSGATVYLNLAMASDGEGGTDTLNAIENATGSAFNDILYGNALGNVLTGGAGHDILLGMNGNDVLIGGSGSANELYGGVGDDTYVVAAADTIIEQSGEGTDLVQTALLGFTLAANIENLTFTGTGNFAGTGNASNNVITGGAGRDTLTGAGGDDTLNGGGSWDTVQLTGIGSQYTIEYLGGTQYRITDNVGGRDGVDIINDVEQVRFGNGVTAILNGGISAPPEPVDKHAGDAQVLPALSSDDFVLGKGDLGPQVLPGVDDGLLAARLDEAVAFRPGDGFMLTLAEDGHILHAPPGRDVFGEPWDHGGWGS